MKICHLIPSLDLRYGGPSRSVRALALTQSQLGHEVEVLTSAEAAHVEETAGARIHTFRRAHPKRLARVPALAAYLQANGAEVIHHHSLWLRTLHYAHRHAATRRRPLVISPRGMMSAWAWNRHRRRKSLASRFIHPGALAAATGWHATSTEEASDIRGHGFRQPICVAPNGVDVPGEAALEIARSHWQQRVPATRQRPVALFYGRFHSKKRIIELIDCWVAAAPREWLLLLVGIPEEFSVAELEAYVLKALGVGRVLVYEGALQPPPYAVASLFLLPSHSENFGLAIGEALAAGVPVLVTDTTPWPALNRNGAGWSVPWEDYAGTLRRALAEPPAELRARGAVGRDWMAREFSWERNAASLAEFYASLTLAE